ncbi:hypothetical protein K440107A6_15780 [Lawsonibacter asaccharolyticus]
MERLTYFDGGKWRLKIGDTEYSGGVVDRLAAYEDTGLEPEDFKRAFHEDAVLKLAGQALGIAPVRLGQFAEAVREGRCVVMPCQPGDKISYKSGAGLLCNAVIDEYTPKNIFITAKTEIPNAEPLSQTFSISEVEAALRRKQDG